MVLSATRSGSTSVRPSHARLTARTILLTSTASDAVALGDAHRRLRRGALVGGLHGVRRGRGVRGTQRRLAVALGGLAQHGLLRSMGGDGSPRRAPGPTFAPAARGSLRGGRTEAGRTHMKRLRPLGPPASSRLPGRTDRGCVPRSHAGRSSGLRAFRLSPASYAHRFPVPPRGQCATWTSFSITAAGQPRKYAGFPVHLWPEPREAPAPPLHMGVAAEGQQHVDVVRPIRGSPAQALDNVTDAVEPWTGRRNGRPDRGYGKSGPSLRRNGLAACRDGTASPERRAASLDGPLGRGRPHARPVIRVSLSYPTRVGMSGMGGPWSASTGTTMGFKGAQESDEPMPLADYGLPLSIGVRNVWRVPTERGHRPWPQSKR